MQDLAGPALLTLGLVAIGGYLLGSIPFGVILTRAAGAGDVRNIGSGNIGATNVLRTGRKDLAIATLILDAGKGAVALLIARYMFGEVAGAIAGGAAFMGHLFPVWLGFKGGKGVATFFGLILAACWPLGLLAAATWLIVAFALRYSSLAALVAAAATPFYALLPLSMLGLPAPAPILILAIFTAVLIYIRHHENIARLLKGAEPKIGAKKA
ncbi:MULTISPECIES: glycerol-3-phosphate 1-O-acyltransferase PlsY [unclassified Brevundimonas]|uniref:glycerol-3-phosphate 1-O-acyltransferase PlsY n=1 Tax=unclassified Brevundimonas TaxID=2622653 RepID=UPI000CFC6454|nr:MULTISPECIES: glycerol-3-phosphate 1-O-acyltransferase PlsY [unclassified Brevundimonas]PRA33614.1 acyl-phosphate glycerol 3-phosphate acyltransferase [Brevundimonas sp. MYb27]PQZ81830.1 acyl-phosphate glycerol 3-phosphate acyltransferase [Brevundimonas sp. MYb31]PRB13318.1 acyl-phosphate glycerol 3-phosphate acyltransferase [Brevundimonas sp. MYb52]PRB33967.1 acyl-phosphate glycerol 3-phosphate acyltransferase [Brevundimonas sp. MYb46]PRB52655.1 acyl-phosphate glycerol 3-phosphate acyltran